MPVSSVRREVAANKDDIADLLQRNEFEAVVSRYESLQDNASEVMAVNARLQILAYARELIAEQRYHSAELLLQRFMVASYRDVDAIMLLAEVYYGKKSYSLAIGQLYEARGDAAEPMKLLTIDSRIRSMVAQITQILKTGRNSSVLLTLYQQLTQQEADYAPWFIGLAEAQLALNDKAAARRSLMLVSEDTDVGAQASAMLAELAVASSDVFGDDNSGMTEVVGIPLYRHGNHFIADARQDQGRNVRLLIDTGATMTMMRPEALEQAGLRYNETGRSVVFNTVNGPVRAPVVRLEYLAVGDWQVSQLETGVLDMGGDSNIDGLLGMNFLMHFQFFIDQNEAMLRLSVK